LVNEEDHFSISRDIEKITKKEVFPNRSKI